MMNQYMNKIIIMYKISKIRNNLINIFKIIKFLTSKMIKIILVGKLILNYIYLKGVCINKNFKKFY